MKNIISVQTKNYSAVFVNEHTTIPTKIIPKGIYSYIENDDFTLLELCEFIYTLDGSINYTILKWQQRTCKPNSQQTIKRTIDEQKCFVHLLQEMVQQ